MRTTGRRIGDAVGQEAGGRKQYCTQQIYNVQYKRKGRFWNNEGVMMMMKRSKMIVDQSWTWQMLKANSWSDVKSRGRTARRRGTHQSDPLAHPTVRRNPVHGAEPTHWSACINPQRLGRGRKRHAGPASAPYEPVYALMTTNNSPLSVRSN